MPYLLTLSRHTFSLNQSTQLILDIFKSVCDQHFKKYASKDNTTADFAVSDKQLKTGILARVVSIIENLNEGKYNANIVTLNQIENIKLDPKADQMLEAYMNEIDMIYKNNGITTKELDKETNIDEPVLMFRVLLLRIVTIALCNDNTNVRDGEVLLRIYSHFIDRVLCHIEKFYKQDIFGYFASKEHVEWMGLIGQTVCTVKLIHSHEQNFSESMTMLKSLTRNIECMLLAQLYLADSQCEWPLSSRIGFCPYITSNDLADKHIESKLYEYESYLKNKNKRLDSTPVNALMKRTGITTFTAIQHLGHTPLAKSILEVRDVCDNAQLGALLALKNNNCPAATFQKIETLYSLYFKSRCLSISLEQIDQLITTCSWVPLVMGMIDLTQICRLMRIHCELSRRTLSLPNEDLLAKLPFKHAVRQKSFTAQRQLEEMTAKIASLEDLQNPVKIQKIKYHIAYNMNNLIEIQSVLEISLLQCQRDNRGFLSMFNHNLIPSEALPAPKVEEIDDEHDKHLLQGPPQPFLLKLFSSKGDVFKGGGSNNERKQP